jgi:hypothetical protein
LTIAIHHAAKTHRGLTVRRRGAHLPALGRSPAKILSVAIARFGTAMVSKSNVFIIQNSHRQFLATNIVIIWQQLSHPKSALVLVEGAPLHTEKFTWRPPLESFEQITESFTLLKKHLSSQHLNYCT